MTLRYCIAVFLLTAVACQRHSRHEIVSDTESTNTTELLSYLNELLEEGKSNNAQIYFKRAQLYYSIESYDNALQDVAKALQMAPTDMEYLLLKSKILGEKGEVQESITIALQAEQRGLRNYELYKLLAVNYLQIQDIDAAKKSIERLIDFNTSAENYSLKGDIYLELRDTATAINSFNQAIAMNANLVRPYTALHQLYLKKDSIKAENYVDTYLGLNPESQEFLQLKADFLAQRESYDSALSYYKQMKQPLAQDGLLTVGQLLYKSGRYDSALYLMGDALSQDSTITEALLLSARSYDQMRNYTEARNSYQRLIEIDSTNESAIAELDKLNRKVAYLQRLRQQELALDSIRNNAPPVVERKEVNQ